MFTIYSRFLSPVQNVIVLSPLDGSISFQAMARLNLPNPIPAYKVIYQAFHFVKKGLNVFNNYVNFYSMICFKSAI